MSVRSGSARKVSSTAMGRTARRTVGLENSAAMRPALQASRVSRVSRAQAVPVRRTASAARTSVGLSRDAVAKQKARLKANEDFLEPVSTLDFDLSSKELRPDYSLKKRDMAAETPRRAAGRLKPKKKKKHTARKVALALITLVLLVGGGVMIWGNGLISKLTGGKSGIFDVINAMGSNVKLKTDEKGRTNVLVFGTSGYSMDGDTGNGEHDGSQLTDSIMVVSLDQETNDVAMISLPRDLYVGNTCTATGKVNEVYYCNNLYGNDEEGGAAALTNTVEEILGIDIQYHVHLDWGALIQIVDGIGGITVTLDEDIEDDWTGTYITAGVPVELNGERALGLARARHGTEMGDFTRGNSQQKILSAIQNKLVNGGLDFGSALALVEAIGDNVRMNFSLEEIKSVYYIAKDISLDDMRQVPLIDYEKNIVYMTTADMNGISYVVPVGGVKYYTAIQAYVAEQFKTPEPEKECTGEEPCETIEDAAEKEEDRAAQPSY